MRKGKSHKYGVANKIEKENPEEKDSVKRI